MTLFTIQGKKYRWRDWPTCNDLFCGCGQDRGEHNYLASIGADNEQEAIAKMKEAEEYHGCTILTAEVAHVDEIKE